MSHCTKLFGKEERGHITVQSCYKETETQTTIIRNSASNLLACQGHNKRNPSIMFEIFLGTSFFVSVISYKDMMLCWAGIHLLPMMKTLQAFERSGTTHPLPQHNLSNDFNLL
jgi:hypothetical protein